MANETYLQVETPQRRTGLRVQEGWECFLFRETKLGRARWNISEKVSGVLEFRK